MTTVAKDQVHRACCRHLLVAAIALDLHAALPPALLDFWLAHRVVHSPCGHVPVAIRGNEAPPARRPVMDRGGHDPERKDGPPTLRQLRRGN